MKPKPIELPVAFTRSTLFGIAVAMALPSKHRRTVRVMAWLARDKAPVERV